MLRVKGKNKRRGDRGMTLIELMISLVVLTVGMAGMLALILTAIANNNKAKMDTGGTLVAQMVIETVAAQPNATLIPIQDCSGANLQINTAGAAAPGAGAQLTGAGAIDFAGQTYAAAPASYKMQYVACGAGGMQTTYDVRWNVLTMPTPVAGVASPYKVVTVSARPIGATNADGTAAAARFFQPPATLRTIAVASN